MSTLVTQISDYFLQRNIYLITLFIAIIIIPLISSKYLPLQDYPDWLYQASIIHNFNQPSSPYPEMFEINKYPVPNSSFVLVIAFFNTVFSPLVAGKLTLVIWLITMPLSYIYFYRSYQNNNSVLQYIIFILLYNLRFYHGNISFLMSLPLLFFIFGILKRNINKLTSFNLVTLAMLLILIFISHFIGYVIAIIGLFAILKFENKRILRLSVKLIIILAPSLLLTLMYIANKSTNHNELAFIMHISLLGKLASLFSTTCVTFSFDQEPLSYITYVKAIINVVVSFYIIFLVIKLFISVINKAIIVNEIIFLGGSLIIIGLLLPTMFFYVTDADTRLFYIGILLLIPAINFKKALMNKTNIIFLTIILGTIGVINIVQIKYESNKYNRIINEAYNTIGPNKRVLAIMGDFIYGDQVSNDLFLSSKFDLIVKRMVPQVNSLMRLPYYYYIKYNQAYPHIFQTSIITTRSADMPLMIKPFPKPSIIRENLRNYDYLYIVGSEQVVQYFVRYFSEKCMTLTIDPEFAICRIIE